MQHVSTYNSHLQAKLRTVIALQGGCAHLGLNMAYSVLLWFFVQQNNCNCNLFAFYKSKLVYNNVDIDIVTYILI